MGRRSTVTALVATLALSGCGGGVNTVPIGGGSASPSVRTDDRAPMSPADLVGSWRLADTPEDAGAVLRIAPERDLSLWLPCGGLSGEWAANAQALMVASLHSGSGDCDVQDAVESHWLHRVTGYRRGAEGPLLTDASGDVVARLLPGGRPTAGPDISESEAEPPGVNEIARPQWQPAEPLPPSVQPVPREKLLGRWVYADPRQVARPKQPHLHFHEDGRWTGSDGCNSQGGRYAVGEGGALLATVGVSTLVGCLNVPVTLWLSEAARAGIDDGSLALYDATGKTTARLHREPGQMSVPPTLD